MLSEGRLEVGLGAGWVRDEYDGLGVTDGAPGRAHRQARRVRRRACAPTGPASRLDVHGEHVDVSGFAGLPKPVQQPGPPIMIGGGAPKILGLAGRLADIVSLNFNNASGRLGSASVMSSGADETAEKISWIRDGAGDRFDEIEIEIGAYFVGGRRRRRRPARRDGGAVRRQPPSEFASHPHALFGSVEQICDTLLERRERFGVSYVTVAQRHLDEFAPVVAAMAGRGPEQSAGAVGDVLRQSRRAGSASSSTIVRQNSAAGTPSTTRWSQVRLSVSRLTRRDRAVDEHDVVTQPTDAEDAGVRRVDHRREDVDAERAERADTERAALEVGGCDRAAARGVGEAARLGGEVGEIAMGGVADDRHEQPVVDGDRQADVDLGEQGDPRLGDLGVERAGASASARAVAATT